MSEAKHTPGPWEVSGGGVWGVSPWNARVLLAEINIFSPMNGIDGNANALLIAAAPELLEALVSITDQLERIGDTRPHKDGQFITDARAAIAKATGAQS